MSGASRWTAVVQRIAAVMPRENAPFTQPGTLAVKTGTARFPIHGGTYAIDTILAMVGTAPTGASIVIDIKKNGVSIYGTPANRPTIAAGSNSATVGAHTATTVTTGDYLTVDIVSVGSTIAGADLVAHIRLKRTA